MNDSRNRRDNDMSGKDELGEPENRSSDELENFAEQGDEARREPGVGGRNNSEWDDSRLLVPSSLEFGHRAVDRYINSRQIVRMKEPRTFTNDDLEERRIIYPDSDNRRLVNHFRNLRTKLVEHSAGNNFTLVVTGASEGSGASFVALNLAAAFAFDHQKTALIIDCNLRQPTLHTTLDIKPEFGLTDFLDEPDYDIARILYPTGITRLRLIPAGSRRETPGEFFTSFRMKQFLQAVRRRYPDRFIILDTASIAESPDARILSELCDYTLLVIPHGRLTPASIEQAATAFNQEKFVGVVING
ncbi:polysaccharide biosynthesis protein [Marinobacter sp. SS21]|uniref:polysaccharide biosynthesis protein n=1 Tax=Marinobacter sp. SS21 TaxID=2979460 RepID=UPI00232D65D6|nr:polysaccharide biosynthesis protein [Marinobacter sp. SS21]MDC0661955.1 polysaccharide biosynthesis protein [Marinobacter sp. SS21]